ncbi:conserved hypothetical protein [Frankia sp. AiPs1]|uniref:hypothetical protein n=1 Tax=Frankia sp. AiPa1 TaxID=573492 RepID=UPI00202BA3CD|nr:hypothetical protein [Frankia sp. AiPa1]MCL9761542.1 hypothetical protein [Frankia sp. AiPa1]
MPVLRLALDELTVDVLTDVTDLEAIRAGIRRAVRELAVAEHRTVAGGIVAINWRAARPVRVHLDR